MRRSRRRSVHEGELAVVARDVLADPLRECSRKNNALHIAHGELNVSHNPPLSLKIEVVRVLVGEPVLESLHEREHMEFEEQSYVPEPLVFRRNAPLRLRVVFEALSRVFQQSVKLAEHSVEMRTPPGPHCEISSGLIYRNVEDWSPAQCSDKALGEGESERAVLRHVKANVRWGDVAEADDLWQVHLVRGDSCGRADREAAAGGARVMRGMCNPLFAEDLQEHLVLFLRGLLSTANKMREFVGDIALFRHREPECMS